MVVRINSEGARVTLRISDTGERDVKKTSYLTRKISRLTKLQSKSSKNVVRPKSYFLKQAPSSNVPKNFELHESHSHGKLCFHPICNFKSNLKVN